MTMKRTIRRRARLVAWPPHPIPQRTRSRPRTLALVARIPAAAFRRPRTQGAWSIRDVLVHIAAWEAEGARRLALIARGRGDRIVWYDTAAELDAFNARVIRDARRLGRGAILRRLAGARTRPRGGLPPPPAVGRGRSRSRAARDPVAAGVRLDPRGRAPPRDPRLAPCRAPQS